MVLPLDMPDDYIWQPGSGKSQLSDLGELAVRLGSPVSYDRRGSVYWVDDFENGIGAWQLSGTGSNYTMKYVSSPVHAGLLSMKLTTDPTGDTTVIVTKSLPASLLSSYGFECTFSVGNNVGVFSLYSVFTREPQRFEPGIFVRPYAKEVGVIDADEGAVVIDAAPIADNTPFTFHTIKFTCDLINLKYSRLMIDQYEYDISDYGPPVGASLVKNQIVIAMSANDNASGESDTYVDNVIVTVGDP